jgi:hypothetical protein
VVDVIEPGGTPVGVGVLVGARYRLEEVIGGGAMGTVWKATDERLNRVVAVKQVLTPPGATAEQVAEQREHALREGRIAARVNNVHAIAVYDVAVEAGEPWLVMEYLPSSNLAAVIAAEMVLPVTQAAQIGAQVADAMVDVHAAGILHRDIKPANVLVGEDGDDEGIVKITDFGIAHADGDPRRTEDGALTGTPAYFAPELARGAPSTTASDVFSLGATLFACLEGVPPFGRDDDHYVMLRRVAAGVTDPMTRAGIAAPFLARMLAPDPADRPTMAQVRDELAELAAGRPDAVPEVLAARTKLVPLSHVAAGLGAAAAVGAAIGAESSVGSGSTVAAADAAAAAGPGAAAGSGAVAGPGAAAATGADAAVVGGADAAAAPAGVAAAAPEVAPVGTATTTLTTTAAKAGGMAVLLSKPVLIAASVGAVVLAGGGAAVVLGGSSGTTPSAASSTQPAPTPSVAATPAGAERAVRSLLTRLPTDPAGALATAGPSLQGVGPAAVTAYFRRVTSLEVVDLSVQDGGTVTTDLLITLLDGTTTTRTVAFTVTPATTPTTAPTTGTSTSTVSTPPSPTTRAASSRPGQGAPAATATPAALVVDSTQLAALLTAAPSTTPPPTSSTTAPPATSAVTAPSPAVTPTSIPGSAPAPATATGPTTPSATGTATTQP